MITSKLQGGLCNQMFQIAAAHSLAISNNDITGFNFNDCYTPNQGFSAIKYKKTLFKNINEIPDYNGFINNYIEPNFSFNKIPYANNLILKGYFQSEKYFKNNKKEIIDLFFINPIDVNFLIEQFNLNDNKTVTVHIRRGDYLKYPDFHLVCDTKYYQQAIEIFDNTYRFIFISDDIEWCKENFNGNNYIFSDLNDEILDLTLMSLCSHNILSNSSFSWWGSYLNNNKNKIVVAPKNWFGNNPNTPKDTQDIYCDNWIKI